MRFPFGVASMILGLARSRRASIKARVSVAALACALALGAMAGAAAAQPSEHPFEVEPGSFHMTASTAGAPDYQAGAHADWTFTFNFAHNVAQRTFNDLKDNVINVPAGFMGNANKFALPTCTDGELVGKDVGQPECPPGSQIGTISLDLTLRKQAVLSTFPVYDMEVNSFGVTAELGFNAIIIVQAVPILVRPVDSGLTAITPKIQDTGEPHNVTVTIWGLPAAAEHDPERGRACYEQGIEGVATCKGGGEEAGVPVQPFLANPTSCTVFTATMKADSWQEPQPASWLTLPVEAGRLGASAEVGPVTGCERVHFNPSIRVQPTTGAVESPSGLDLSLEVPQTWEDPNDLASSNLKDTRVALPVGYTVNPSAGNGLAGCTPAQYAAETSSSPPSAGCPPESKLGEIEIETPLLAEKLKGAVYLAQPYDNLPEFGDAAHPGGSLLALYVIAKDPARGIIIKTPGKVEPNPVTGQLVSTFKNTPQQPFSRLTLEFTQSQTSPLVSPPACGSYTTQAELTPWSAPGEPRLVSETLQIEKGIGGGPCPTGGVPPFKPQLISGTQNNAAGSYSPFYLRIVREDGEQEITRFSTTLPPGLTGNLSGIPFCPDAGIEAARGVSGAEEEADPSCPRASEVGHTIVEAGVGTVLAQTPGKIYLAGPYNGAPLSIVSITSAKVGPFDLGTVVVRFALNINPTTAQVEVSGAQSEAIPHIIKGIVVHVRDIRVYMDRPNFIINPTNCNALSIAATIDGAGANFANPADQVPVTVGTPFQAADCSSLTFKPAFKVSTSGKTSKANGASLSVKLSVPTALGKQANIALVKVELPKALPSRLTTLRKACLAATFDANPAACPAASIVGRAVASTPILPVPLIGPAYFVSHGGEAFPSLIIVLQGYGFTVDLVGSTFINGKTGVTSSTFKTVPDVPVGTFELTLPQGPFSALAANRNLCTGKGLTMPTEFLAQNGASIHQSTKIAVTGCPRHKAKAKKAHRKKARHPNRTGARRHEIKAKETGTSTSRAHRVWAE